MRHTAKLLTKLLVGIILIGQVTLGCANDSPVEPPAPAPEVPITWENASMRILFIGNSLTSVNNLPGLVEMIGQAAGMPVATRSFTTGGFSLEEHWATGVADKITEAAPTLVVMQQGPSSLPENQVHLRTWATQFNPIIRSAGAEPAMLMIWPSLSRAFGYPDVFDSYRNAALAIDARFIPAGEAFRQSYADHGLKPYSRDNFHPSILGSTIAALSVLRTLNPAVLDNLPGEISSEDPTTPNMDLQANKELIFGLVDAVVQEHSF